MVTGRDLINHYKEFDMREQKYIAEIQRLREEKQKLEEELEIVRKKESC